MKVLLSVIVFFLGVISASAQQPANIVLNPNGTSKIYPVFDTNGWTQTFGSPYHNGDDFYAQDWARSCGTTARKKAYAGISGKIVVAGYQSGFGNTVVIYDQRASFALRYAHLSEINVSVNDFALAGITEIGKVGNTGTSVQTTCQTDPGAHLHLSLYRNVTNPNARPVTSVSASGSATTYAANFGYASPVTLIKGDQNPTVYVRDSAGYKRPVTAFAYETNGWGFSNAHNFVSTNSQSWVNSLPTGANWPPRSNILLKGSFDQTVYLIEDGARRGVPGDIFSCRNWNFADVRVLTEGAQHSYQPTSDVPVLNSCYNDTQQAIKDMVQRASSDWRFDQLPFLHQYSATNMLNDPNWEWRQMLFRFNDGRHVWMAHITYRYNPWERYTQFWDPDTGQNTAWIRAW